MKNHALAIFSFVLITCLVSGSNAISNTAFSSLIQDPRKNSTFYDIILKYNAPYGSVIGDLTDILMRKKSIDKSTKILNFKLIYYSPQLIPSTLLSSTKIINQSYQSILEPIFSVDTQNGTIYIKTPNEPILEYLCLKKPIAHAYLAFSA